MRQIPQMHPVFDKADAEAVRKVVESGWTSEGPLTKEFEERVAKVMGYRYGVACCNGTVAISLALIANGVEQGDRVVVPDLTFVATANAAKIIRAEVKFVDILPDNFGIDWGGVASLEPKTNCVLPVDLNGRDSANATTGGYVVDAAQALGSPIQRHDRVITTLSFAPNKIITTAQGGMVLIDDEEIMEKVRRLKDHGRLDKSDFHPSIGFDFKFSDLQAALGLSQLDKLSKRIDHKRAICKQYHEELKGAPLTVWGARNGELLWCQDILVQRRDELVLKLLEKGIQTRAFYAPLHTQPAYKTDGHFPVAESVSAKGLWLPSSSDLTEEDVSYICESIRECLK